MSSKYGVRKLAMLVLVAIAIFALPLAAGAADMANGITSPKDGATVSGTVDVKGYATDPTFCEVAVGRAAGRRCGCGDLPGCG